MLSLASSASSSSFSGVELGGPAFVFVIDACSPEEELRALKNEVLHIIAQLPEIAVVGLVSFGGMVCVHDLGFSECSRAVVFHGERELSSEQVIFFIYVLIY